MSDKDEQFSEKEIKRRRDDAVRRALNTRRSLRRRSKMRDASLREGGPDDAKRRDSPQRKGGPFTQRDKGGPAHKYTRLLCTAAQISCVLDDSVSESETEQRFKAIARAVLTTPPIKKKDIPRKQRKQAKKLRA